MGRSPNLMADDESYSAAKTILQTAEKLASHIEGSHISSVLPASIPPLPDMTLPELPQGSRSAENWLFKHITPYLNRSSLSPNYYGFVTGGATPAALSADVMVSYFDQNVAAHLPKETISTTVEVAALNMLVDLFHLPKVDWGIGGSNAGAATFTTGATASNVLGLALGREYVLSKAAKNVGSETTSVGEHGLLNVMAAGGISRVQVLSTMPHSSIAKAASIVGIGRANVVSIAKSGTALEIDLEKLEEAASETGVANILTISSGEVNTGRFATDSASQLRKIREICNRNHVWVHVDGAFGLFGRVLMGCETESEFVQIIDGCQGIELADSITGDGHKLLNVPYDCGFFFSRHKSLAEEVFRNGNAPYLSSGAAPDDEISSPQNIGIENSRRFRALPVYATLGAYGRQGYIGMLRRQVSLARRIASWVYDHAEYELLPGGKDKQQILDKTFIIVIFRAVDIEINESLVERINRTRKIYVTGTKWERKPAVRIAVSNWQADVERDGPLIEEVLESAIR